MMIISTSLLHHPPYLVKWPRGNSDVVVKHFLNFVEIRWPERNGGGSTYGRLIKSRNHTKVGQKVPSFPAGRESIRHQQKETDSIFNYMLVVDTFFADGSGSFAPRGGENRKAVNNLPPKQKESGVIRALEENLSFKTITFEKTIISLVYTSPLTINNCGGRQEMCIVVLFALQKSPPRPVHLTSIHNYRVPKSTHFVKKLAHINSFLIPDED
ncbi:hypothetical protein EGR_03903 [Echinococcus granulosus]|uniref:Uncharacterized protein n=1 Tax=Echinococcus granulosus TaxID=6210 RepID=W6UJK3_ECHGR|nr:hypothetical protein EGR_03903 [Echinococcus granulosus]EUB61228.1 hypothetical protein EGR_03903 [Echinococcus granulosus]